MADTRVAEPEIRLDVHSIEPIPEQDKDSTSWQQFWIWAGANIAPINWILGALGIVLGLGLMETILIVVIGNLVGCAIFAAMTVMGHKTGVNQMVLSRSAFGRRGGYLSSWMQFFMTMGWIGVNTYFPVLLAVGILGHFGVKDTFWIKFLVVTGIMIIQVGIGVYGFYLIRSFEKYTVPVTMAIMLLMSILAWSRHGIVDWGLKSTLTGSAHFSSITGLITAIGVGWGISWVTWASDYSRFVPKRVSSKQVFWYSYWGLFIPTVWLAILGATIASADKSVDPARLVTDVFGGFVAVLVMLMVLHGPIATNILNVYSSALAAVSAGIRASRMALGLVAGVVGYAVTLYFVSNADFATKFDNWMVGLILWMSPWAGVILADFYLFRKQRIDVPELYADPERSAYGDVNWIGIGAFVIGLVAGWLFEFGLVTPLQGYVSKHFLSGADLSWLVGLVVAGAVYLLGMRGRAPAPAPAEPRMTAVTGAES
ncbi:MAG TPA: cytosine permease [Actinomycetota bacterium]|nr:cytosine permease [Actinomycetota bacterium]